MTSEIAVLRRAREIISDPLKWTQGTYARDRFGDPVEPDSQEACRWCAIGAISYAAILALFDKALAAEAA